MNSLVSTQSNLLQQTQAIRDELLDALADRDLACRLGGHTLTLGALCREMGEVEHAYIQAFKTFKQDFSYRYPDAGVETSVAKLRAWYKALDVELSAALTALTEDDIQNKLIDRGGWSLPVMANFHIYRESLIIFYGKASLYLRAMEKPLPKQMREWIA